MCTCTVCIDESERITFSFIDMDSVVMFSIPTSAFST